MNKIYLVFVLLLGFNLSVFGQFPGTPYFTNSTALLQPPTIGTATAGAGQATIAYIAPASNGGAVITSYTATSSPGGLTGTLSQAGSGVITVTGLTNGTPYTFTVKATNAAGISTVSAPSNSVTPLASVNIDTQRWTNKNLEVTTYSDGTVIPQVTDPTAWAALTTGAWCYINNTAANGTTYGKLYNWYAVAGIHDNDPNTPNKVLAPTGWHIPTDAEWTTLTTFLGGESVAGGKMKITGTTFWTSPNTGATNSSGFSALQGGYRDSNGSYFGFVGYWWSSSELNATNVWSRYLSYNTVNATRINDNKAAAFSVRCLVNGVVPSLTTTAITAITPTTASSGGSISNDDGATVIARGVCWSTSPAPTVALSTKTFDGSGTGVFTSSITGLTANTTYYVRAYATNSVGTGYGAQVSFKTSGVIIGTQIWQNTNLDVTTYRDGTLIPEVTNNTAWGALTTGAWCYYANTTANGTTYGKLYNWFAVAGIYDAASAADPALRKQLAPVGWHIPSDPEWDSLFTFLGGVLDAGGKMKSTGTSLWLSPNAVATNSSGFTGLPGGFQGPFGGFSNIGNNGVWWSSTGLTNNAWEYLLWTQSSSVHRSNKNKRSGNSVRCVYGTVPPTLTTFAITEITTTTASAGGSISLDGGGVITARGVCWSTSAAPTIALNTKTTNGTGMGAFTSAITGLIANTTYYVRAYATNSAGTAYGQQVSFKTSVIIGTQIWQNINLDVTTYSDGTLIPQVTDPTAWSGLTTGAWCYYNNDAANGTTYGKLYNWYAVAGIHDTDPSTPNKRLAPSGWHIPTYQEWRTLTVFLGGESVAGGKMKSTGTTLWTSPNTGATNSSGFTGIPGGYRDRSGTFTKIGNVGCWWSDTSYNGYSTTPLAYDRLIGYDFVGAISNPSARIDGFSVRCVRD